jgi:hypothetical protein
MQTRREWEGVSECSDGYAGGGLHGDTYLAVLSATLRRQLLHKSVAGIRLERQALFAAELGAAHRVWENISVIADDQVLTRLLGRAVPAIDRLGGEYAVVMNDEGGRYVSQ